MTNDKSTTRECPYCKEAIRADATKCKHCGSSVMAETPAHEGICPYCKEQINPEAVKCKHCKSILGPTVPLGQGTHSFGCGCGEIEKQTMISMLDDLGQLNIEGMPTPNISLAQQQLGFAGFSTKCFYFGPFFGWWCCLYLNGTWLTCANLPGPLRVSL